MIDNINNKIQELGRESLELSNIRQSLLIQLKEIDTRLTQIVGAMIELKKIKEELVETSED